MIDVIGDIYCDVCMKPGVVQKDWYTRSALPVELDLRRDEAVIDPIKKGYIEPAAETLDTDVKTDKPAKDKLPDELKDRAKVKAASARFDVCEECVAGRILGSWGDEAVQALGMVKV